MSTRVRQPSRLVAAIGGIALVVVLAGGAALAVASGFGVFASSASVTALLPKAGPELGPGSEVQYRGVLVGTLGSLHRSSDGAVLNLHLDPSQLSRIPAGVTVRLMPRSVFGDLYVDLVPPQYPSGSLHAGATLRADTSTPTVELDQALDAGYRLLTAVQPAKLDAALTAMATALNGRGAEIGSLIDSSENYLRVMAPHTDRFLHDVTTFTTLTRALSRNAPNLLRLLDDAISVSRTIASTQPTLAKVLNAGPTVSDQTRRLLASNRARLNRLVHLLAPVIGVLGHRRGELVRTVKVLQHFLPDGVRVLNQGAFLKIFLTIDRNVADGTSYTAADCPRYPGENGPNCPHQAANSASRADAVQQLGIAQVLLAPLIPSTGSPR